jgi:hypothetical protein
MRPSRVEGILLRTLVRSRETIFRLKERFTLADGQQAHQSAHPSNSRFEFGGGYFNQTVRQ